MSRNQFRIHTSESSDSLEKYEVNQEEIEIQREVIGDDDYDPFVVTFYFNKRNVLYGFMAKGSTGFVQYGLDIIAAGVSALIINTIHSIQHLTKDEPSVELHKNFAKCIVDSLHKNNHSPESRVLLKALEIGIHSIQNTYGEKYVTIEKVREENDKQGLFGRLFR